MAGLAVRLDYEEIETGRDFDFEGELLRAECERLRAGLSAARSGRAELESRLEAADAGLAALRKEHEAEREALASALRDAEAGREGLLAGQEGVGAGAGPSGLEDRDPSAEEDAAECVEVECREGGDELSVGGVADENVADEREDRMPELSDAGAENEELRAAPGGPRAELDAAESRIADLESRLSKAESENGDLRSRRNEAESRNGDLRSRLEEADSKNGDLESRLNEAESRNRDLHSRLKEAESANGDLESRIREAENEYDALEADHEECIDSLHDLELRLEEARTGRPAGRAGALGEEGDGTAVGAAAGIAGLGGEADNPRAENGRPRRVVARDSP